MRSAIAISKYQPVFPFAALTDLPRGPSVIAMSRKLDALVCDGVSPSELISRLGALNAMFLTAAGKRSLARYCSDAKLNGWWRRLRGCPRSVWVGSLHPQLVDMWQADKLTGMDSTLVVLRAEIDCDNALDLRAKERAVLENAPELMSSWRQALLLWLLPRFDVLHLGYKHGLVSIDGYGHVESQLLQASGVRLFTHAFQSDESVQAVGAERVNEWTYPANRATSIRIHRSQSALACAICAPVTGRCNIPNALLCDHEFNTGELEPTALRLADMYAGEAALPAASRLPIADRYRTMSGASESGRASQLLRVAARYHLAAIALPVYDVLLWVKRAQSPAASRVKSLARVPLLAKGVITALRQAPNRVGLMRRSFAALRAADVGSPRMADGLASKRVVMLIISDVSRDPRVERGARALASNGFPVTVIYPQALVPVESLPMDWGAGIDFTPVEGDFFHFVTQFPYIADRRLLDAAMQVEQPFAFHCHDLWTALVGLQAARSHGAYCVADFHEWYSENVTQNAVTAEFGPHSPIKRHLYKRLERECMERADTVITVCDSIARELEAEFPTGRKVELVRNIPTFDHDGEASAGTDIRELIQCPADTFVFLWQGGLGRTRLIEPIIEAMREVDDAVLVIRGPGIDAFRRAYLQIARSGGFLDRVFCLPPVASARVVVEAASADVGIWSLPNIAKNFYYALPNKVFEYLAAGLPIIGAHFPEVKGIVDTYEVGTVFDPYDPKSIARSMRALSSDRVFHRRCRENVPRALAGLDAANEWDNLVRIYRELGPAAALPASEQGTG